MFTSLLSLPASRYKYIAKESIQDLNLAGLFEALFELVEGDENVVYSLCQDRETIMFRQEIIQDFLRLPGLMEELEEQLKAFGRFRFKIDEKSKKVGTLYYLLELLLMVEASIDALSALYQTLCYYEIRAGGLIQLKASIEEMMAGPDFKQMKEDRKAIRFLIKQVKSVEIAINMNSGMRPYGAQVTQVNQHRYRYPKAFRQVADTLERTKMYLGHQTKHYVPVFPIENMSLDMLEEIEYALKDHRTLIKKFIDAYNKIDAKPFLDLHEEVTFYYGGVVFFRDLIKAGMPLCYPSFIHHGDLVIVAEGALNIALLQRYMGQGMASEVVANDFRIEKGNVILLTGPNSGGKTTFTQMVGQLKVLGQLGFPVPAVRAEMTVNDSISTHFPMIEQASVDYGRFGRACHDFQAAFEEMTDRSLMLMNESFSGTSHLESLEIASQVLRALSEKGYTTLYNTHLHDLYDQSRNLTGVLSWTAGEAEKDQAYIIREGAPIGHSHGLKVAREKGVTYDQLTGLIGGDSSGE